MFTGITSHVAALVTTAAALTGAPILRSGAAAADPSQDDQFLAILEQENIPALKNVPSLIVTAHKVCRKLDGGMRVDDLVDMMINDAYAVDPPERLYPPGRLARTETRFIIAAVEAYCPGDQAKIASVMADRAPGPNEATHRAAYPRGALDARSDAVRLARSRDDLSRYDTRGVLPAPLVGSAPPVGNTPPAPPQIPAPPPAQKLTPPRPAAAPPPRQQPPPQLPPPAPQPGNAAGGGGGGPTGGVGDGGSGGGSGGEGGRPVEPPPAPPMPPGFVRLAP